MSPISSEIRGSLYIAQGEERSSVMGRVVYCSRTTRDPSSSGGTIITPYFGEWGKTWRNPTGILHSAAEGVSYWKAGNLAVMDAVPLSRISTFLGALACVHLS